MLLTKYLKAGISYEGIQRVEEFPFPKEALREALLNAIIHKDYSSGIPIQISVYDDKIYFWNDGHLPESWTIEKLMGKHPSKPYNPLIANAFFRAGLIESWGRGIEKIYGECRTHGIPAPSFNYEETGLMLLFTAMASGSQKKQTLSEMSEMSESILKIIQSDPSIKNQKIAEVIGVSTRTIEREIKKLKDLGKLKRKSATRGKGATWEVL